MPCIWIHGLLWDLLGCVIYWAIRQNKNNVILPSSVKYRHTNMVMCFFVFFVFLLLLFTSFPSLQCTYIISTSLVSCWHKQASSYQNYPLLTSAKDSPKWKKCAITFNPPLLFHYPTVLKHKHSSQLSLISKGLPWFGTKSPYPSFLLILVWIYIP